MNLARQVIQTLFHIITATFKYVYPAVRLMFKEVSKDRFVKAIPILIYLLAVYFLAYLSEASLGLVLLGTMPSLLHMMVLVFFDVNRRENHVIVFLSPIFLSVIFLLLWSSRLNPDIAAMEGPTVAFLNVVIGYFMIIFFIRWKRTVKVIAKGPLYGETDILKERIQKDFEEMESLRQQVRQYEHLLAEAQHAGTVSDADTQPLRAAIAHYEQKARQDAKELARLNSLLEHATLKAETSEQEARVAEQRMAPLKRQVADYHARLGSHSEEIARLQGLVDAYARELDMTKKEVRASIRSVEDKCKALNFVIGRVYADSKGGNKTAREKLKIPRELYNDFSEILSKPKRVDADRMLNVLRQILAKLQQMELPEDEVIRVRHGRVPIERLKGDTVLKVLARNDKDPVLDYHDEAKMVCKKLLELMEV